MIQRLPHVELVELARIARYGIQVIAVAQVRVDGADVEPLHVTSDEAGNIAVRAGCIPALKVDLHSIYGGLRFAELPEPTRDRIVELIVARVCEVFHGDSA